MICYNFVKSSSCKFEKQSTMIFVSFIPFFVFCFWSLLVTKLRKYEDITESLFTFCKARWAGRKKNQKENHTTKVTKILKTKRLIWNERNI